MKTKMIISLAVIWVALAAIAILPAKTYVPSSDELALVVGGADWVPGYKKCGEDQRCTGTNNNCPSNGCSGKMEGDACGSYNYFYGRGGCVSENFYRCKIDECESKVSCHLHLDCECEKKSGSSGLDCKSQSGNPSEVHPCVQKDA